VALNYQTPGVYYETFDASPPVVASVRTDVAGFVGIAQRGPIDTPIPVQSWRQFRAYFGDFIGGGFLAYSVRAFFENGGRRCWIVRVASRDPLGGAAAAQSVWKSALPSKRAWRISASSPGAWGNNLIVSLKETHEAQAIVDLPPSTPAYSVVSSISGFARGSLVMLNQGGTKTAKVVSGVDAEKRRLIWVQDDPLLALPYDRPLPAATTNAPASIESVEYSIVVRESGTLVAQYSGLSLVPEHPRYGPAALSPLSVATNLAGQTVPASPRPIVIEEVPAPESDPGDMQPLVPGSARLSKGVDGLALLEAYDFIGEPVDALDDDETRSRKRRGLRALAEVAEVAIIAVPDIHIQPVDAPRAAPLPPCESDPCFPASFVPSPAPVSLPVPELPPRFSLADVYRVQDAMLQVCEDLRDRFAVLDPPFVAASGKGLGISAVMEWRERFDSKYGALYYPWTRVLDPLRRPGSLTRNVPPSGHVAGQYARTDLDRGVHVAPANASLAWVQDVTSPVNDAEHGVLNPLGINAIRTVPGRGILIFGARTLSSDPDWRYVNVRRLLMMIEKAIDLSTQWVVFEGNDHQTRAKLRLSLMSFLTALWARGALAGDTAGEAFYVKCDEENNPPAERDKGKLLTEIGVAPAIPSEFVVLRVGRTLNELEIVELSRAKVAV
jgi:hypothetical protein